MAEAENASKGKQKKVLVDQMVAGTGRIRPDNNEIQTPRNKLKKDAKSASKQTARAEEIELEEGDEAILDKVWKNL
jgi:hypothetical protein